MNPLLILGALALAGGAVFIATSSKPVSSPKGSSDGGDGGTLGGTGFSGKDFSDESITEGELAEAASHGNMDASRELEKRKLVATYSNWCGAIGLKESCKEYLEAGYSVANAIARATGEDLAKNANTPEQKARLSAAVGRIISLGYPPTSFDPNQSFGVDEQATVIENDIARIMHGMTYKDPLMGPISIADMLTSIGRAAVYTAGRSGEARDVLNTLFLALAVRRSTTGVTGVERPIYLLDNPVTVAGLASLAGELNANPGTFDLGAKHAVLAYIAAAGAGRFGMPLDKAYGLIVDNAASFNLRHGLTTRSEALGGEDFNNNYLYGSDVLVSIAGPAILAEAWKGFLLNAPKLGYHDNLPDPIHYELVSATKFNPFART